MSEKTLAARALDARNVRYELFAYRVAESAPDVETHSAAVAQLLGVPAGQLFKTLVVVRARNSGKPLLIMVPTDRRLNLKKLAKVVGAKKVRMAAHKEAERLTGLQVGGISALALLDRGFEVFLDQAAEAFDEIFVSGGRRGVQLKLGVADLVGITKARIVEVAT